MTDTFMMLLLWFGAIGCGVMAGIYFAFSVFIMKSLSEISPAAGIAAMQSINLVIVRSPFIPLFFGTSLAALASAVIAALDWGAPGNLSLLAAGVIYFAGMFLCTLFFNIPLNNKLAAVDPGSKQGRQVWAHYLQAWTRWNHARTLASTLACGLFILAILERA